MKSLSLNYLAGVVVIGAGLVFTGCQQTPPTQTVVTPAQPTSQAQPAPTPQTTESTTTTKSTEVKPADPDSTDPGVKTTTTESTTVKKKP